MPAAAGALADLVHGQIVQDCEKPGLGTSFRISEVPMRYRALQTILNEFVCFFCLAKK